jgi:predicted ABC-type exoprotein transport system permease subunit
MSAIRPTISSTAAALNLDLVVTLIVLVAAAICGAYMIWLEHRPATLGEPRLLPTTSLLFVCALVIVLACAHLVSLVTGAPHVGRFG